MFALLVETHAPSEDCSREFQGTARSLLKAGWKVRLHLIQNGVIWLQQNPEILVATLNEFHQNLNITADDVSLILRGMSTDAAKGIAEICGMESLVRTLALPSVKTIWHS